MNSELGLGISHFLKASAFLARHRLLHYYAYPLITGFLYYFLLTGLIFNYAGVLTEKLLGPYLPEKIPEFSGFFSFLNFLGAISVHGLTAVISGILVFLVFTRFSKYIILILLSPIFSLLSERVDEILLGKTYPFSIIQFMKDILRGTLMALRNFILEMMLMGLFGLASVFSGPFSILLAPVLWLTGAYFYGFSMADYTCERKKMSIPEGIRYIRKHRMFVLGNGIMYSLIAMIPVIGMILAPINAVVGASSGLVRLEEKEKESI